jgi:hypothetical protein
MGRPSLSALVLLVMGMGQASACSCIRIAPEGFRMQADVIVYGRVISVDRSLVASGGPIRAKIRVLHPVKGRTAKVIRVETPPHSAACGVEMLPGQGAEYLLMRRGKRSSPNTDYSTNLCLMIGSKTR